MPPDQTSSIKTDLIGILLDQRYELQEIIGEGGMGAVYQARDNLLKREVAVKVLIGTALNDRHRSRLLREAQAVASLNHPNIVSVHDMGEHEGMPYIVMELVRGHPLDTIMPVSLARSLRLCLDICRALDHAHAHGVIHRDIKPENVLITEQDGITKLVDFGLAYKDASRLTKEGEILGTIFYTAPEQITGRPVDVRTDLYGLGILMYELVTEELPFQGDNALTLINHHLHTIPHPPCIKRPLISSSLNDLILKLMMKLPDDRPSSAAEITPVLEELIAAESSVSNRQIRIHPNLIADSPPTHQAESAQSKIRTWKAQGQDVLDATSLSLLHRYPQDVTFDEEDLLYVVQSALHLDMDLEPWLDRSKNSKTAIGTLVKILDEYPRPEIRQRIVNTLVSRNDKAAIGILLRLVKDDNFHEVRSLAAVEASRWGYRDTVLPILLAAVQKNNDPVALTALVAVADEVGLPEDFGPYPRLQVMYALFQRRWKANKKTLLKFAMRGGWGTGLFMLILGLLTPLYSALLTPANFVESISLWSAPVWSLVGGTSTMVIGWLQGYIAYLAAGISELLWPETDNRRAGYFFSAIAGVFFGVYEVLYISLNLYAKPQVGASIYYPMLVCFSVILGFGLTTVIPPIRSKSSKQHNFIKVLGVSLLVTSLAVPFYWLIYMEFTPSIIVFRLLFVFVLIIGAGLNPFRIREEISE